MQLTNHLKPVKSPPYQGGLGGSNLKTAPQNSPANSKTYQQ
ncbi:hypothetical protein VL20_525 [Microcystis panniformis FACHB-1757]|uniref:Uncharacterized protein n=1 Tax=Microcystis panniformis FACHB-1757 TaxID=1638788 RepID=A0A0K1RVF7_9CHRO|nr:hypothetical protein VL20_525 [Microcystis panniformis FACHB-1757]